MRAGGSSPKASCRKNVDLGPWSWPALALAAFVVLAGLCTAVEASGESYRPSSTPSVPLATPHGSFSGLVATGLSVHPTANPTPQDAGRPIAFSAWVSGCGALGCTYSWTWDDGTGSTAAQHTNHTFVAPGVYQVTCWANSTVVGSNGEASLSIDVVPPPAVQARGTPVAGDVGFPVELQAIPSGGVAPLTISWQVAERGPVTARDVNATYTTAGSYANQVWANDSSGASAHAWWNLTVHRDPSVTATAAPTTLYSGEVGNFTATGTGGTPPLSYAWAFGNGSFANGSAVTRPFLAPGLHHVYAWANDSDGVSSMAETNVTVLAGLAAVPTVSQNPTLVGTLLQFRGAVGGGTPPYTFAWTFGDGNIARTQNATHDYGALGKYPVSFWVNDSTGHSAHGALSIEVEVGLTVSASANATATDAGLPVGFQASASGGSGVYNDTWTFGDGASAFGPHVSEAFPISGTYTVRVWTNDSAGAMASGSVGLTVNPALSLRAAPSTPQTDVGAPVDFSASTDGGSAPVSFTWGFESGARVLAASSEQTFPSQGTESATVWANDSVGAHLRATVDVVVVADPKAAPQGATGKTVEGALVRFWGNYSGGTGPYSFLWGWGDGGWSTSENDNHTYASPGTYTARFWVNDSLGTSSNGSVSITVLSSPGSNSPPGNSSSPSKSSGLFGGGWALALLAFGIVVVVLVLVMALSRGRRLAGATGGVGSSDAGEGGSHGGFLPPEEADHTGTGEDLPPWPATPLTVFEGVDREVLYRTAARREVDPHLLFILTASEPGTLRAKWGLTGAVIWQISRLEGEERIPPGEIDRIASFAEAHLNGAPGRAVLIDAVDAFLSATGVGTTSRFLHVLHEAAEKNRGVVLVFLNPREATLQERRSLEEGARRVRFGPRVAPSPTSPETASVPD